MSSIGPQLPPHLTKRKRTPEDESDPWSPPPKQQKSNDEIDLHDDDDGIGDGGGESDDSYGPSAPLASSKPVGSSNPSIGPSLPPISNTDEIDLQASDSEDDYAPRPPPQSATQTASTQSSQRLPPSRNNHKGETSPSGSDSDSESDYGPSLPAPSTSAQPARTIGPSLPPAVASVETPPQKRDDWMLAPPASTSYTERDPTKLRARKFASSKASSGSGGGGDGAVSSIWTETPEQKLQRLQNAVLGRNDTASSSSAGDNSKGGRSKEEEERHRQIAQRVESSRGKSLYEEHQGRRKALGDDAEEEDDPSKRGFDREKDMALGGRIGTKERSDMMERAKGFGSRFQSGSFL